MVTRVIFDLLRLLKHFFGVTEKHYFNFDQFPSDWRDRIESADLVGVQKRGRSALL
jgi:hypothetical protein